MADEIEYKPQKMVHPNSRPAVSGGYVVKEGVRTFIGTPQAAVFPPVTVNSQEDEDYHRAMGYVAEGEQAEETGYQAYPKWLYHPTKEPMVVNTAEHHRALLDDDEEWSVTP